MGKNVECTKVRETKLTVKLRSTSAFYVSVTFPTCGVCRLLGKSADTAQIPFAYAFDSKILVLYSAPPFCK